MLMQILVLSRLVRQGSDDQRGRTILCYWWCPPLDSYLANCSGVYVVVVLSRLLHVVLHVCCKLGCSVGSHRSCVESVVVSPVLSNLISVGNC
jgi:hypothetical protein